VDVDKHTPFGIPSRCWLTDHPWYDIAADDSLEQGDFLTDVPVVVPPDDATLIDVAEGEHKHLELPVDRYDLVVLTQTCDLITKGYGNVLCCQRIGLANFLSEQPELNRKELVRFLEQLRLNRRIGFYLLPPWPDRELDDYQVIDFRNTISLPIGYARYISQRSLLRLRLKPPYREHMAQAFAYTYMRVALEADVRKEDLEENRDYLPKLEDQTATLRGSRAEQS
jgi:hypothetical protein